MNFEREMQQALKVIFQNIQALDESRNDLPDNMGHAAVLRFKRRQPGRKKACNFSLHGQKACHLNITVGQEDIRTKKISL